MNKKVKKKFLIICHDAGGAEIVSAYVKKNLGKYNFSCIVAGPAEKVFKRKKINNLLLQHNNKKSYESVLKYGNYNIVLTGTSWASCIELDFIKAAKQLGVKTATYLEHWTDYRERFGYPRKNWEDNLPDEIWVGDKYALKLAKKFFSKLKIKYIPNLYFQEIKKEFNSLKSKFKNKKAHGILFMSEPISSQVNSFGDRRKISFNEFGALKEILNIFAKQKIKRKIIVRFHPSEKKDKYDFILNKYLNKLNIIKSKNKNILSDLARARTVIGINSMALVIASICGKKTISFIPSKKIVCSLPTDKMLKVKNINNLMRAI